MLNPGPPLGELMHMMRLERGRELLRPFYEEGAAHGVRVTLTIGIGRTGKGQRGETCESPTHTKAIRMAQQGSH